MTSDQMHPRVHGLLRRSLVLTLALLLAFVPLASGIFTAGVALFVCFACGLLSMLVTDPLRQPKSALQHLLLSTGIRTGIPLVLLMVIYLRPGPMTEAGFVYYLLTFYLVSLLVETGLMVQSQQVAANGPPKAS